jgi:hypothetical protein
VELRCESRLHGELLELEGERAIEVKCRSKFCGHSPGVVVLHRFDLVTGKLLETKRYRELGSKEEQ